MNRFAWRWLVLLAGAPACVLIEPLDPAESGSSGSGGEVSLAGGPNGSSGQTGSAGSDVAAGGMSMGATGGDEPSGGTTSGGKGSGGMAAGGRGSGGTTGSAGRPGTAGAAGSSSGVSGAPSGGAGGCQPPGGTCTLNAQCCQSGSTIPTAYGATCIESDDLCHADCMDGDQCATGCCTKIAGQTVYGVCDVASECGCLVENSSCTSTSQCCGGSAATCDPGGKCRRLCAKNADCPSDCCDPYLTYCVTIATCPY